MVQGGHAFASIFNGPGDAINLDPMDASPSLRAWEGMNNTLAAAAREGRDVTAGIDQALCVQTASKQHTRSMAIPSRANSITKHEDVVVNDILSRLGTALSTMLSPGVDQVILVAEVHDEWIERRYDLRSPSGLREGVTAARETNREVNDRLYELRQAMHEAGQANWHHCTYVLKSDGGFDFAIDYDRPPTV